MEQNDSKVHWGEILPVFGTLQFSGGSFSAAHPDHKGPLPSQGKEEILTRIGNAYRKEDGTLLIQLVAFPVNGQLILQLNAEKGSSHSNQKEEQP